MLMPSFSLTPDEHNLQQQWLQLQQNAPKVRIRDAATLLDCSEAALVALGRTGCNTPLMDSFADILEQLSELGSVLTITRNDLMVHEVHGTLRSPSYRAGKVFFFSPDIDLRLDISQWAFVFGVEENNRYSLQFFDQQGQAAFKVYCTAASDLSAYHQLIDKFHNPHFEIESLTQISSKPETESASSISRNELLKDWSAMVDVHQSGKLIKRYGNNQENIYNALSPDYALALDPAALEPILEYLSSEKLKVRMFVRNNTAVQSFSGVVRNLIRTGPWFNVLDEAFNLHAKTPSEGISAWLVAKPDNGKWVHAIYILDQQGKDILVITELRNKLHAESLQWQHALNTFRQHFTLEVTE